MDQKKKLELTIQKLRTLNQEVPTPLRLPKNDDIIQAEKTIGTQFPEDYKFFLLNAGDVVLGCLEPCTVLNNDFNTDLVKVSYEAWKYGLPKTLLPICQDNGDYYCFNDEDEIVFWSHNGTTNEKWADLATWIEEVWIGGC